MAVEIVVVGFIRLINLSVLAKSALLLYA